MHKIDTIGATVDNKFKTAPLPATIVGPDWLNTLQEELVNIVTNLGGGELDKENNAQAQAAIAGYVAGQIASTKTFVERVITDPLGGDVAVDYDSPQQLLAVILDRIVAGVGGAKAYTDHLITDEDGGDSGLDYYQTDQLLVAVQRMIGIGVGGAKAYTDYLITDEDGGDAGLDYGQPAQLLQAVQRMIGLAIGSAFSLTVEGSGDGVQRTLSIAGGLVRIKMGYFRETITGEVTRSVAFLTDFPAGCWHVHTQDVIAAASHLRDLRTQIIPGSTTVGGFTVQFQSDAEDDLALSGFDWLAIGN